MVDLGGGNKTSHVRRTSLSFPEIVGQKELKRALLTVAANGDLDGLLIQGEKGTAKSTAVRALTDLLPNQTVVEDCPYGCPPGAPKDQCSDCRERAEPPTVERSVPLVTLPLGATRERVVGTLSVADALAGEYQFDPGLLARANRGILYVDEVNLLDDHLVDLLLDAAASGINRVERDGVSVSHPSRFTLVGTMNPEEGDLRPQLRDRFALQATVTACEEIDERITIIDRAIGRTDGDALGGSGHGDAAVDDCREQLRGARERLGAVELSTAFVEEIAELCRDAGIDGHRGDIATARAAMTFAALDGRRKVIESDVRRAAELALPHRLQSRPFEDVPDPDELIDEHFDGEEGDDSQGDRERRNEGGQPDREKEPADEPTDPDDIDETDDPDSTSSEPSGSDDGTGEDDSGARSAPRRDGGASDGAELPATGNGQETSKSDDSTDPTPIVPGRSRADIGEGKAPELAAPDAIEEGRSGSGTRSRTRPNVDNEGPRARTQPADSTRGIDAAASVRAAATRGASAIESRDLRRSVRESDASTLVLFVVDASASMLPAMRAAKGTVLELLKDVYQQRDEVAFIAFAGDEADVLLPPTNSVTLAARHLKDLPTGDRTPLPAGLRTAGDVLERAEPTASVVVLVTDGRANVANESPVRETRTAARRLTELNAHMVVVDAGEGGKSGLTGLIADETNGECVPLAALSAERVDTVVGAARESQV
ncbi:MAG: ATP-binding protein [Haloarculaceae archaeon]